MIYRQNLFAHKFKYLLAAGLVVNVSTCAATAAAPPAAVSSIPIGVTNNNPYAGAMVRCC